MNGEKKERMGMEKSTPYVNIWMSSTNMQWMCLLDAGILLCSIFRMDTFLEWLKRTPLSIKIASDKTFNLCCVHRRIFSHPIKWNNSIINTPKMVIWRCEKSSSEWNSIAYTHENHVNACDNKRRERERESDRGKNGKIQKWY